MDYRDFFNNQLVQIIITIALSMSLQYYSRAFIEKLVRRAVKPDRYETKLDATKRHDTVTSIFHRLLVSLIWIVAVFVILAILQIDVAKFLTGAGLFGVIVGLGAQNTIKDYLAGVYILTGNLYRVGDIVSLSGGVTTQIGTSGMVEEITLRITKLRDLDGTLNIVRNGDAGIITNRSFKFSSVVVNLNVDYDSDLAVVESVVNEVGKELLSNPELNRVIVEPVHFFRVEDFNESGVRVQCIAKVAPAAQWDVASEFRRQLKPAFDAAHIRFAVPQRSVKSR